MKPRIWGMIVFLLTVAVAATPASGGEPYAVAATMVGDATYMALNPDGTFSDQEDMLLDHPYLSLSSTAFGNGIGDFNNDGWTDLVVGNLGHPDWRGAVSNPSLIFRSNQANDCKENTYS